jgi:phosphatidylglycerophosphate synthase
MSQIASTYKARDVEETVDVWFYRPLGYAVARACIPLGITPNAVTIASIVIGVAGGHLLWYRDAALNAWGITCWIAADILDSTDGQIARMTNHKSKLGRILDGFGGNLIFTSMYLHLAARMAATWPGVHWSWFFLLVLAGGLSHSFQSAVADYYRNAYLRFVVDPSRSELDGSEDVRREYEALSFARQPLRKFLMRIYLNYTVQQESISRNFQVLRKKAGSAFDRYVPEWFSSEYRRLNLPMMKYYAILTTNTRMFVMMGAVLLDVPWVYFAAEIILINAVLLYVIRRQEGVSAWLSAEIDARGAAA